MLIANETSHVRVFFNFFLFHEIILNNINVSVKVFNIKMVLNQSEKQEKRATLIHYYSLGYM